MYDKAVVEMPGQYYENGEIVIVQFILQVEV